MTISIQCHIIPNMGTCKEKIHFYYSPEKNAALKKGRGISFEEVELAITEGSVLTVIKNPNQDKYPNQNIYVLNINNYVYLVPYVEKSKTEVFLKTIIPSRKALKKYLKK